MIFILMRLYDLVVVFPCALFLDINYMKIEQFSHTKERDGTRERLTVSMTLLLPAA